MRLGGSGVGCGECVGVEKVGKSAFVDDVECGDRVSGAVCKAY